LIQNFLAVSTSSNTVRRQSAALDVTSGSAGLAGGLAPGLSLREKNSLKVLYLVSSGSSSADVSMWYVLTKFWMCGRALTGESNAMPCLMLCCCGATGRQRAPLMQCDRLWRATREREHAAHLEQLLDPLGFEQLGLLAAVVERLHPDADVQRHALCAKRAAVSRLPTSLGERL